MQTRHCLYCGQEFKLSFDELEQPPWLGEFSRLFKYTYESEECGRPLLQYTCTQCGLTLTQTDLEKDEERRGKPDLSREPANSPDRSTEEETLEEVKGLFQKCLNSLDFDDYLLQSWDALQHQEEIQYAICCEALDLLFRRGSPLQHPLEFALCRDLCRTASLLLCDISDINGRYQQLDIMLSNVQHLHYFLSQNDPEDLFRTLTRLSEIILILGSLPIRCHTKPEREGSPGYTDLTCRKRAAVIGAMAIQLEGLKDSPHGTEYLKMALQLWRKVLEQGQEISLTALFNVGGDSIAQLPRALRVQIIAEIHRLNEAAVQRDPRYIPEKLPVQPILYYMPARQKFIIAAVSLALLIGFISVISLNPSMAMLCRELLEKVLSLMAFGLKGEAALAFDMVVYSFVIVFGWMFLEPKMLCFLYKMLSPR